MFIIPKGSFWDRMLQAFAGPNRSSRHAPAQKSHGRQKVLGIQDDPFLGKVYPENPRTLNTVLKPCGKNMLKTSVMVLNFFTIQSTLTLNPKP